jgi:hypothetical protein
MTNNIVSFQKPIPQQKKFTLTWRCKGLADGSSTLLEAAARLEAQAKLLRQMSEDGLQFKEQMSDDYAFVTSTNQDIACKYGMQQDDLVHDL